MPVKSKAQLRWLGEQVKQGKMSKEKMQEWIDSTPNIDKLPDKVGPTKPTGLERIKNAKVIK